MISVVCVYNNRAVLQDVLLNSLKSQTARYELIALDNTGGEFRSAAEALNQGGLKAKGDYIMFVHQDVWLASDSWLEDVETILKSIPDLGVAGVAGMSDKGRTRAERIRFAIAMYDETCPAEGGLVERPEEVQTLDECVLIVPREVFDDIKFDQDVFDGWDCYGADYCLSAKQKGLKVCVVPAPCSHSCSRAAYPIWHFKGLLEYQNKLYKKHRGHHGPIHTWMGDISWANLRLRRAMQVLGPLYHRLFPTVLDRVRKELADCESVLDLGCGHHSPLQTCDVAHSVGVEMFEPSLAESRRRRIHDQYILADIGRIQFQPRSFDAVVAIEVLEHIEKDAGIDLLGRMEQWARKKIIVTTPNGFVEQETYDDNPLQEHRSAWNARELKDSGFTVHGALGWKRLRGHRGAVRCRPEPLWERVSDLTQKVTYYLPELAFQLYAVKRIGERD